MAQGGFNEAVGGEFRHGFYAAFFSSAAAEPISEALPGNMIGQTVAAAAVGGTASVLGGGKFANGAVSGAFTYLFNSAQHPREDVPDWDHTSDPATGAYLRRKRLSNAELMSAYGLHPDDSIWIPGILTLEQANDIYRSGRWLPVSVDLTTLDISGVTVADFKGEIGSVYTRRVTYGVVLGGQARVFGSLDLKLVGFDEHGHGIVRMLPNLCNFDQKPNGGFWRNLFTKIGSLKAGPGIPYEIKFRGERLVQK